MKKFAVITERNTNADPLSGSSVVLHDTIGEAKDYAEGLARRGYVVGVYRLAETVSVPVEWGFDATAKPEGDSS